jgi:hypothetical protein
VEKGRVPIRRGFGYPGHTDISTSTAEVFDDDRPIQVLAHGPCHRSRVNVDRSASGVRNDEPDRTRALGRGVRYPTPDEACGEQENSNEFHLDFLEK